MKLTGHSKYYSTVAVSFQFPLELADWLLAQVNRLCSLITGISSAVLAHSLFYRSSARKDVLTGSQKNFQENYIKSLDHQSGIFKQARNCGD